MEIRTREQGDVRILELDGPMRLGEGDVAVRDVVRARLDAGDRKLVLDLRALAVVDSVAISEMVRCYKRAQEAGGRLRIVLGRKGREVFGITGLDAVFDVHGEVDEAVRAFGG